MTDTTCSGSDTNRIDSPIDTLVDGLAAASRYDFALGIVPFAYVIALIVANATTLSTVMALVPASVIGLLVIVDVCYRRPPVDRGRNET